MGINHTHEDAFIWNDYTVCEVVGRGFCSFFKNENLQDFYYTHCQSRTPEWRANRVCFKEDITFQCHFTTHFPFSVFGNISFLQHVGREPLFGEMRCGNKEGGDDHTKNIEKVRS